MFWELLNGESPEQCCRILTICHKSGYVTTYAAGNIGSVSIEHFDIENKNISGTFNFTAKNSDYQSITIKDGEFQIQY